MKPETQHKQVGASSIRSLPPAIPRFVCLLSCSPAIEMLAWLSLLSHQHPPSSFQPQSFLGIKSQSNSSLYPQHLVQWWHTAAVTPSKCFWMNSLIFYQRWFHRFFFPCVAFINTVKRRFLYGTLSVTRCLVKALHLRHCIDSTKTSGCRNTMMSLLSDALAKENWRSVSCPEVRHQQINEGRGEAATDGHLQELSVRPQTHPKHLHLTQNELREIGLQNHKTVRQSPKGGLRGCLSSPWLANEHTHLWLAHVTEKSQNFCAERE